MIIDGKKTSQDILEELSEQIKKHQGSRAPCLAYILVGEYEASHLYVKRKVQACERVGINVKGNVFEESVCQKQILELIHGLNLDPTVDGILVQMPLPSHINAQQIVEAVSPQKDVDGFHPFNIGRLLLGYTPFFVPCTPLGIHELLMRSNIQVSHKNVVIMGRSNIVGKPLAALLMQKTSQTNATVTVVHSHTSNLEEITLNADVLITAMGSPELVKAHMVKKGAIVIDVGINRLHGKLVGDVDFKNVEPQASQITPVPGGVGPMTIAMLLSNTLKSYQMKAQLT
ncbi:MAG: Bifunctional protein FolD protein [Chlamydiae bacterium]|nr:Bifunctional protein FolD protein [Chlamydiota bacterium]